jgi:hypothetical protein
MISTATTTPIARIATARGASLLCVLTVLGLTLSWDVAAAAQIYKTIDANGNVVFSDLPPAAGTAAESVELPAANTFVPPANRTPGAAGFARGNGQEAAAAGSRYQSLRVLDPPNDAGLRDNAGNVVVTAELQPSLRPGHVLQLYLDGVLHQAAQVPQFQLVNVDRGTHVLELRVVDSAGHTVATSEPSVFHLQRRSLINQPAPPRPAGGY